LNTWFRKHPYLAIGILIAPLFLWLGFVSAGFGHGDYVVARIILPFSCLLVGGYTAAAFFITTSAILQWPVYGLLIDRTSHKVRMMGIILLMHGAVCCWLFTKGSEAFR
jgi:hypothetical protein